MKKFLEIVMFLVLLMVLVYIAIGLILITTLALNYGVFLGILATIMSIFSFVTIFKLISE